jgi:Xaa-Pro aminopeptidase
MPALQEPRRERLRGMLAEQGLDAAVITSLVNVRYLTGFTGSNAALLITPDSAVLATDGRYIAQSAQQSGDLERVIDRQCAQALLGRASGQVGFEAHIVTVAEHAALVDVAPDGAALVDLGGAVERLRRVKDETEIAYLREACAIGDRALARLLPGLRPGQTERQIARRLESLMYDEGAHALSFETIVAGGPNSAVPHHEPGDRPLEAGDFLKCDFGAAYEGYHADMTRTFVVGAEAAGWQRDLYELVRQAQRAGRHALAPGASLPDVDRAARSVVEEAGYGEAFSHGLGHGVGLEIHEAPLIGYAATGTLDASTPVTVEPGVYLPGRGGVRIEDTLVVRPQGPELLTTSTKELLVV